MKTAVRTKILALIQPFAETQIHSIHQVTPYSFVIYICYSINLGDRGSTVVKVLCYKSDGR